MPASNIVALSLLAAMGARAIPLANLQSRQVVYACPEADQEVYTTPENVEVVVQCGKDYQSGDFFSDHTNNFEACMHLCAGTNNCKSVAFAKGEADDGWCYLKNGWGSDHMGNSPNVWGAVLASELEPENTDEPEEPELPEEPETGITCPNLAEPLFTATNGDKFKIECSVDHAGGDVGLAWTATLDACIEECSTTAGCVDVSFVAGTPNGACYMKGSVENAYPNSNVWGALDVTPPAGAPSSCSAVITSPKALSCPETVSDICYYSSAEDAYFKVECFQDRAGFDLPTGGLVWTQTYAQCIDACAANEECKSVAWNPGHGTADGPCYLKSENTQAVYTREWVWGAILVEQDVEALPTVIRN